MKLKRGLRGCNSAQLAFQRAVAPTGQRLAGGRLAGSEPYLRGERRIYGPVIETVHAAARLYGGQRPGARVGQSERGFPFRQQFNGAGDTNVPEQPVCARMAACIEG